MKEKTPKSKPKFEWTDVPARPLPRHVSFVLEDILSELRQIREAMEKTGTYPIPNPSFRFPDDRPLPTNYPPWYPQYCYTKKELEDKFGVKK